MIPQIGISTLLETSESSVRATDKGLELLEGVFPGRLVLGLHAKATYIARWTVSVHLCVAKLTSADCGTAPDTHRGDRQIPPRYYDIYITRAAGKGESLPKQSVFLPARYVGSILRALETHKNIYIHFTGTIGYDRHIHINGK
jgi:hypothetical protein